MAALGLTIDEEEMDYENSTIIPDILDICPSVENEPTYFQSFDVTQASGSQQGVGANQLVTSIVGMGLGENDLGKSVNNVSFYV